MLNDTQLTAYCDRRNLSPQARRVIQEIRNSPPSRRTRSGACNVACRYASHKMGSVIQAESHKNELPAVIGWEFDPATHEFYDQPPRIKLNYRDAIGRSRGQLVTPDYFLLQDNFAGWIECKTEEWLRDRHEAGSTLYVPGADGGWRCPAGEEYAALVGLQFRVHSSAEIHWVLVRNAEFLADYLDDRAPAPAAEDMERIHAAMAGQAWIRLKELIDADHGVGADVIFKMIADGDLYVALDRDLLAEPERATVFRDRLSAEAYRLHIESSRRPLIADLRAVSIEVGQQLTWDGAPWRIVNIGDEDVYLENADRVLTPVRRQVLEQLVRDGKLAGCARPETATNAEAEDAVRRASPTDFAHALVRYKAIFPDRFADSAPPVVSARALRKWRALYRQGEVCLGSGFLGLVPKMHRRGNRERKLDPQVLKIMKEVIDEHLAQPQGTLVACWGRVQRQCGDRYPAPSEQAFRNEVRRRDAYELKALREGRKAAYDQEEFQWYLEATTPRHGERPFEIAHIDHTQLDLQFVGSRNGENLAKAWLSVMIDGYTRTVLAWAVRFEEPSYRSCMTLIRNCIRRHSRMPQYIVTDGGSEFASVYYECLLAYLECHKKTRPGGKPRFGSLVERVFGTTNENLILNLAGNNRPLQNPRRLSKTHDPRLNAVWTLPKFVEAFEGYIEHVYHQAEHPAHGMTPKQAMAVGLTHAGLRSHKLIPYTKHFAIMCLPSTPKGVATIEAARGIKINYLYYWTPEFRDPALARAKVSVRYDPNDVSVAFVWLKDHWAPCQSEMVAVFKGRSEKEIDIATQELRARNSRAGRRRVMNARLIAAYLEQTDTTEKSLLAQKRHQESLDAEGNDARPSSDEPAHDETPDDVWANLNLKFFGEFK